MNKRKNVITLFIIWMLVLTIGLVLTPEATYGKFEVVDKLPSVGLKSSVEYTLILKKSDGTLTDKSVSPVTHYQAYKGQVLTFEINNGFKWREFIIFLMFMSSFTYIVVTLLGETKEYEQT